MNRTQSKSVTRATRHRLYDAVPSNGRGVAREPSHRWMLGALAALGLLYVTIPEARAKDSNPGIIPPNANYGGHTYAEWQALANVWSVSLPAPQNPTLPGNDAMIANGQPEHVWFILTFSFSSTVERDFTVPAGKALYVFILDQEWDNVLCTDPPTDYTIDQMRGLAAQVIDSYGDFQILIDGVPLNNVEQYRSGSTVFYPILPSNSILDFFGCSNPPGNYGPAIADGYHILLPPPSVGEHVIDEKMVQHVVPGDPSQDVPYEFIFRITVVP